MMVRICSLLPDYMNDTSYITRICGVVMAELALNTSLSARDYMPGIKIDPEQKALYIVQSSLPLDRQCSDIQIGRARAVSYGFNRGYEIGKGK